MKYQGKKEVWNDGCVCVPFGEREKGGKIGKNNVRVRLVER